jgi:hypothetical protein
MPPSESQLSIQESLYPDLTCFGCGHANPDGFHIRSYRDGDHTVATFTPRSEHDNGFGFFNGGIITTVLDCLQPPLSCGRPINAAGKQRPGLPFQGDGACTVVAVSSSLSRDTRVGQPVEERERRTLMVSGQSPRTGHSSCIHSLDDWKPPRQQGGRRPHR